MLHNVLTPPERLLLGPGPSNPDPAVRAAMAAPLVGHLDPWFIEVMEQTMGGLRRLYRTTHHHTVPVSGTGTAGLETLLRGGVKSGVNGTPTFFVNGERYDGIWTDEGAFIRALRERADSHARSHP